MRIGTFAGACVESGKSATCGGERCVPRSGRERAQPLAFERFAQNDAGIATTAQLGPGDARPSLAKRVPSAAGGFGVVVTTASGRLQGEAIGRD